MAGESEVAAYLSRLTGETVSAGAAVRLRSVQRAAFAAWARKQAPGLRLSAITAGEPFVIGDLFVAEGEPARAMAAPVAALVDSAGGIGIDIEEVAALPEADDYRAHAFYQENFSAEELAHCIRQTDVRASLCGIWAAKEAAIKAGLFGWDAGRLGHVVIGRDAAGRPTVAGGQLSISHTATTAVAVCLVQVPPVVPEMVTVTATEPPRPVLPRAAMIAGYAVCFLAGGAISLAMRGWL
jgi:phosphopantetheinyl transferase (holo-ACP synthase)